LNKLRILVLLAAVLFVAQIALRAVRDEKSLSPSAVTTTLDVLIWEVNWLVIAPIPLKDIRDEKSLACTADTSDINVPTQEVYEWAIIAPNRGTQP
jgi:hypothetical protein